VVPPDSTCVCGLVPEAFILFCLEDGGAFNEESIPEAPGYAFIYVAGFGMVNGCMILDKYMHK